MGAKWIVPRPARTRCKLHMQPRLDKSSRLCQAAGVTTVPRIWRGNGATQTPAPQTNPCGALLAIPLCLLPSLTRHKSRLGHRPIFGVFDPFSLRRAFSGGKPRTSGLTCLNRRVDTVCVKSTAPSQVQTCPGELSAPTVLKAGPRSRASEPLMRWFPSNNLERGNPLGL